jgi:hypothetical protein
MEKILGGGGHEEGPSKIRLVSKMAPDYKAEYINGAISNLTPRGEIVCDFHLETRDRPTEQIATVGQDGTVVASEFLDPGSYTKEVKFGIVMNASFAKDLVAMLNQKIKEAEEVVAERAKRSEHK